ncbi:MAG: hypothetical protein R2749_26435 [Acidimicrobiales bacterium]
MATMEIEPLHERFGARVRGIDVTAGLDDETLEALRAAIDEHSVLVLVDQPMTDEPSWRSPAAWASPRRTT